MRGFRIVFKMVLGSFLRRIGCEGITNFPNGIDISDAGDVLIGDSHGNRFHVAVYRKSGELMCEFDCPYAKVSILGFFHQFYEFLKCFNFYEFLKL